MEMSSFPQTSTIVSDRLNPQFMFESGSATLAGYTSSSGTTVLPSPVIQDLKELNASPGRTSLLTPLKPHATIWLFDLPITCLMGTVKRDRLNVGPWYLDRDPRRSIDPFDILFSRQEWNAYCEREEQRKREEMFIARIRQQAQELALQEELVNKMTMVSTTTSPRKCKAVKVKGNGGKARIVRLWCKDRNVKLNRQAAFRSKAKAKAKKLKLTTAPDEAEYETLPDEHSSNYRGVVGRKIL